MANSLRFLDIFLSQWRVGRRSAERADRIQNLRLRRMLWHAVKHSPFYRDLYRGIDLEHCQLQELPIVTKSMALEQFDRMVTDPRIKQSEVLSWLQDSSKTEKFYLGQYVPFSTSGTTGRSLLIVYDREAMDCIQATYITRQARPWYRQLLGLVRHLCGKKLRVATLIMSGGAYPANATARCNGPVQSLFVEKAMFSALEPVEEIVRQLNEFKPQSLLTYGGLIEVLAQEQLQGRLHLDFSSPLSTLVSVSEPVSPAALRLARQAWTVTVENTYGTGECMMMARSCSFERLHLMSDLCVLEAVDENGQPVPEGQAGDRVLVTNLFNKVQPFIRYELPDITGIAGRGCPCGSPFPILLPIEGRAAVSLRLATPSGDWKTVRLYHFFSRLNSLDLFNEFQIHQTGPNAVTFRYVPLTDRSPGEERINTALEEALNDSEAGGLARFSVEAVRSIERNPISGKRQQFIPWSGRAEADERSVAIP